MLKRKVTIGRAERIDFPKNDISSVPAKVDTGAFRSSISSSDIRVVGDVLHFKLFDAGSPWYTGKEYTTKDFAQIEVENSFGHKEKRYSIYLSVKLAGRRVKTNFTLANRSEKTYPILLGRRLLKGRFIVDVAKGLPVEDEETTSQGGLL